MCLSRLGGAPILFHVATFIDEKVAVTCGGEVKSPKSFVWRDRTYTITELLHTWPDWGFAKGAKQRNWRSRRHRNYYRVRTDSGEVFELYLDRGVKLGREVWYLYQRLDAEDESAIDQAP